MKQVRDALWRFSFRQGRVGKSPLLVLFLALAWGLGLPSCMEAVSHPNVLLIMADDLRAELGCLGTQGLQTPVLDALARRGTLFERAYCQQAVCNPSRASMLTGRRPDSLRIWDLRRHHRETLPEAVTLPEWFRKHGYASVGIGKIFHNGHPQRHGDPESWSEPPLDHSGAHWEDWVTEGQSYGEPPQKKQGAWQKVDAPDEAYLDGRIAEKAVQRLKALAGQEKPFFLAVGFWKPHLPFNAPERYWNDVGEVRNWHPIPATAPEGIPEIALHDGRELRNYLGMPKDGPITQKDADELRQGYLAAIQFLDAQVGKVLAALQEGGLEKDTLVCFVSDHGFHLGERGLWCKTSNFEWDARVPMILAGPGWNTGQRRKDAVELLDVFPTLVRACNLPMPPDLEGRDLSVLPGGELLSIAVTQHPRPAYYKGKPEVMGYSVTDGRHRLTRWMDWETWEVRAQEWYDHVTDPNETDNLLGSRPSQGAPSHLEEALETVLQKGEKSRF